MVRTRLAVLIVVTAIVGPMASGQDAPALPMSPRLAELVKQLKDPEWDTRMEAATALGRVGPNAKPAIPNLVEALKDPVPAVRMKAIDALMFMGTAAAAAAPKIAAFLSDPDELVRVSAALALPRVTPDPASTVPFLKKALADKAWMVRRQAAIELIHLGAEVASAVPVLREGLKDPIPAYRLPAIVTLGMVASHQEREALAAMAAEFLKASDLDLQLEAIRALGFLGAEAVPHLVRLLESEGEARGLQWLAMEALARIGPDAKAALPALRQHAQRKGVWLEAAQRSIAAIEGKQPTSPDESQSAPRPGSPVPAPSPGASLPL